MNEHYILKDDGITPKLVSFEEWAEWYQTANRRAAFTQLADCQVSTVFLGLDYNFGDGAPLLWETMVFGGKLDEECRRYSSYPDAISGHGEMVTAAIKAQEAAP